ncbi:hypothetical protein [PinkBerry-associated phage LS06-2018-MD08]|nr:hypothetical protein [PinkBerry-associated phage LS06-2018-MD08]
MNKEALEPTKNAKEMFKELGFEINTDYEFAYENNKYIIEFDLTDNGIICYDNTTIEEKQIELEIITNKKLNKAITQQLKELESELDE